MKRQLTEAAQVAKLCKQFLKAKGINCRVKSENYSMGNSVRVRVFDQPPAIKKMMSEEFAKYEEGHFNGMEDIYEYSNSRDDIPQTKFLFIENEYSDELKQAAWDFLRNRLSGGEETPELYKDTGHTRLHDEWSQDLVYRLLNGSYHSDLCAEFWETQQPIKPISEPAADSITAHIEEHQHTKKNVLMYMVVLDTHVEREIYISLREKAHEHGGWYSRQWGNTPGGFAFTEKNNAESFLKSIQV